MGNGRYCDVHSEWAPDGQCRWCEAPNGVQVDVVVSGLEPLPAEKSAQLQQMMNNAWADLVRNERAEQEAASICAEAEQRAAQQMDPSHIAKLLERNDKFAEIGRALYEEWRAGYVGFGPRERAADVKMLCQKLAASEAKPEHHFHSWVRLPEPRPNGATHACCFCGNEAVDGAEAKLFAPACEHPRASRMRNEMMRTESCGSCGMVLASEATQPARKRHQPDTYDPGATHLTGIPVHCPCGCCCS